MIYTEAQRKQIAKDAKGKKVRSLEFEAEGPYWVMTFTDETEISFRFMAELGPDIKYSESDALKDGVIETTHQWLVNSALDAGRDSEVAKERAAKVAKVEEILGDDALIYNVRMDVSTWKDWDGLNSFGPGKIMAPLRESEGGMIFVIKNLFHDERHLREVRSGLSLSLDSEGAWYDVWRIGDETVELPGPYLRAYFAATMPDARHAPTQEQKL